MRASIVGLAATFAMLSSGSIARAQDGKSNRVAAPRPGAAGRAAGRANGQQPLVRELRQRFNGVIQRQLNLSDENARRLEKVDRQFQQQRAELNREEKAARLSLQDALA